MGKHHLSNFHWPELSWSTLEELGAWGSYYNAHGGGAEILCLYLTILITFLQQQV
jgi:hypothetical protein